MILYIFLIFFVFWFQEGIRVYFGAPRVLYFVGGAVDCKPISIVSAFFRDCPGKGWGSKLFMWFGILWPRLATEVRCHLGTERAQMTLLQARVLAIMCCPFSQERKSSPKSKFWGCSFSQERKRAANRAGTARFFANCNWKHAPLFRMEVRGGES